MAEKNYQAEEDIIDLTELIESGNETAKPARAAASYAKAAMPEEPAHPDFEALLAESGADSGMGGPAHAVDPDEQLDMSGIDLSDNLFESLEMPSQNRDSAPPAAADSGGSDLGFADLDSVLDDILSDGKPAKAAPPEPAPEPDPTEDFPDMNADLDSILASIDPPQPEEPSAPEPAVETPPAMDEFDFGDLPGFEPEADKHEPEAAVEVASESVEEEAQDIPAAESAAEDFGLPDDLGELDEMLGEGLAQPEAEEPAMPLPHDEPVTDSKPPVYAAKEPPDSSDSLPAAQPLTGQTYPSELVTGICSNILGAQNDIQGKLLEISRQMGAQEANFSNLAQRYDDFGKRLLSCESKLTSTRTRVAALENAASKMTSLEELLRDGAPLHMGFRELIASAVGKALQNFAPQPQIDTGMNARLDGLDERLAALEMGAGAKEQLEALQQGEAGMNARLDGLDERLAALEMGAGAKEQLEALQQGEAGMNARLDALEEKFADFGANLDTLIERSAAGVVARILQEEIRRMSEGE